MNKADVYEFLNNENIRYEVTEHEAVYNMAELSAVSLPYPESDAKNLFVRDDKKRNYYLITVKGDKKINLKKFKQTHGTRHLSFASENDLADIMKLTPGAVTPLGVLNDDEKKVHVYMDKEFLESPALIGVHPNDNTATVWLNTEDLIYLLREHGSTVHLIDI